MNDMYGINGTGRPPCKTGSMGPAPALGLLDGLIGSHRALHDVTDRRSFGAKSC